MYKVEEKEADGTALKKTKKMRRRKKNKAVTSQLILNALIIFLFALGLYPLLMALWCSFKTPNQYTLYKWFPTLPLRMENLTLACARIKGYMGRTLLVATLGTALTVFVTTMAGLPLQNLNLSAQNSWWR